MKQLGCGVGGAGLGFGIVAALALPATAGEPAR